MLVVADCGRGRVRPVALRAPQHQTRRQL